MVVLALVRYSHIDIAIYIQTYTDTYKNSHKYHKVVVMQTHICERESTFYFSNNLLLLAMHEVVVEVIHLLSHNTTQ